MSINHALRLDDKQSQVPTVKQSQNKKAMAYRTRHFQWGLRLRRLTIDRVFGWHQRWVAIQTLEALNDHYLKDAGIERSEIHSFVTKGSNREEPPQ